MTGLTVDQLETRIEELSEQRDELVHRIRQAEAQVNAFNGAIEDCRYWIQFLNQTPPMENTNDDGSEAVPPSS